MTKKGIPPVLFGYIFAIYTLDSIITSIVIGKVMTAYGRKQIFVIGFVLMGTAMIGFGVSDYFAEGSVYLVLIFEGHVSTWLTFLEHI
jgi:MFS family permease